MHLLSALFISLALTSSPDGFRETYAELDSLPNIRNLVYDGAVTPNWTGADEFVYETREADGLHYFLVNASDRTKTEITSAEYEEYLSKVPERERNRWWRDLPDSVTSPDGRYVAFLRDNNVWVKELSGEESSSVPSGAPVRGSERQLSFDGTEQNYYAELYWSPDSRKVASVQREYVKRGRFLSANPLPRTRSSPNSAGSTMQNPETSCPRPFRLFSMWLPVRR